MAETVHLPWGSMYSWDDIRVLWDGSFLGYSNISIDVLYSETNKRSWILAPQLVRWRSRYRGQRESHKTNLEMQQFLFDIRRLYEALDFTNYTVSGNSVNLEFGINLDGYYWSSYYPSQSYDDSEYDLDEYDGPIFTSVPDDDLIALDLTGYNDIVMRLNRLLKRVEELEGSRIDIGVPTYNSIDYEYNSDISYNG